MAEIDVEVKPLQTTAVDAEPPASPAEAAAVQGADAASGRAVLRRASPGLAPADPGDAPRRPDVAHEHLHTARHPSRAIVRRSADDRDADPVEQEADAVAAHAVAACIVDSAPAPHQREARDFMTEMERRVTETASRELGPTWTAAGCPYIAGLFQAHERSDAATIERLARVYSRRSDVASAGDYFPPILARVEAAVRTWRSGGDISGELRELGAESLTGVARVTALQAAAPRRKADAGARDAVGDDAWEAAVQRPGDAGAPLPSGVQRRLARGFGRQFPEVRIHTDDTAAERTAGIRAQAFTLGTDISFARGRYRPGTLAGEALIAHELAHVVQQDARNAGGDVATAGAPALEKNADALAGAALLARPGRLRYDAGGLRLQRCPETEPMTDQELTEYVATKHLRIVVQQDTKAFLSGMKKSFAVAANEDPAVTDINLTKDDEVVTNLDLDYPRLRAMRFQVPMSGGERMTPITTVHRQTGTWPVALMFPGRYDMTAWVNFGAGRVVELKRSIDVAQADFAGESAKSAPEDLKAVPANTSGLERTTWTVQRAKLRQQAVDAGLLTAGVNTAWTDLSIAVVTRAGALQQGIGVEGTGTQVSKAATAFAAAMPGAPATLTSAVSALRAGAFVADLDRLRTAFEFVSDAFDTWVLAQLEGKEKGKDILAGLKYAASIDKELVAMKARASQAPIRVPAVFHPEAAYVRKEFLVGGPISTGKIVSIPLNLWLLNTTGQTWVLRDISNPAKTFEYKETNARRDAALDILLKKLAGDQEHFPNGRLHVQPPGRIAQDFVMKGEMTYLEWLGVATLGLAAAGLIAVTAGTATPAVAAFGVHLLTVSAATGAAIAVADTIDAYERGRLTRDRLALNAFQFVASIASAGTSRIVAGAVKAGTLAQIGADSRYVLLNRVAAGGDIATLAVMTVDTAHSLLTLSQTGGKGEDAGLRAALAVGQLLAQGTLTIVAAKDTFKGDLSAHPSIELLEETPGQVVVRNPGAAAAATAATPSTASRTLEDLLAKGGKAFAADHAVLRDAYDAYAKAARRRGATPLEPLEWAKSVTQGKAAKYIKETLGDGWRAARRAEYPGSPRAKTPASDVSPVLEKSKNLRTRLDDALEARDPAELGTLDPARAGVRTTGAGAGWASVRTQLVSKGLSAEEAVELAGLLDAAGRTPTTSGSVLALTVDQLRQLLPLDGPGMRRVLALDPGLLPTALSLSTLSTDDLGGRALDALVQRVGQPAVERLLQPGAANQAMLAELGRNALATAAIPTPTSSWAEVHSQSQMQTLLDPPGSGFERYRHPTSGTLIPEPGFRRGVAMDMGRKQAQAARQLRDATFPDIYGEVTATQQAQAMEIKTPRVGETVASHFRRLHIARGIIKEDAGRLLNLPAGAESYLVIDIRQTGQTIAEALADLSTVLRNYGGHGDARGLWTGVRFMTGTRTAASLSGIYQIPR